MSIEAIVNSLTLEQEAQMRYTGAYSEAQYRASRYEVYHKYFAPPGGDQWPEGLADNPGKLHFTLNIIRRFVDTEARLLAKRPRLTIPADYGDDEEKALLAEGSEKLFMRALDRSGFDQWAFTLNQTKSLYGLGVLHPFWNEDTNLPDVSVVEQPQNMMFGWGDSDFNSLDWAIFRSRISKKQAMLKWGLSADWFDQIDWVEPDKKGAGDHADPVETISMATRTGREVTDYERSHVPVWDYWYVGDDGGVYNCTLVSGKLVGDVIPHKEMPVIPYIPIESDHEPGSPDGHGLAELLIDIQNGLNRAVTHYAQHVWDTTDPAYQLTGPEAPQQVPAGLVPSPGEIIAPGPGVRVEEIRSGVNNFPFDSLISRYWEQAHRITGLSEILFGVPPGAQTSARALQAQLDSSINSIEPKRDRYYEGLRGLLQFWHHMFMAKNPTIDGIKVKEVISDFKNWKIVAPEITPRDVMEHTQNVMQKVDGKLIALETGMDEVGVDNPKEEMRRVMAERSNAHLFPGDAQAIAAVVATLQAIAAQQGAQGQAAQGQNAQNAALADRQQAQPRFMEDQNQPGTGPGSPPPQGTNAPIGGELRPIVREAGGQGPGAMSELRLPPQNF